MSTRTTPEARAQNALLQFLRSGRKARTAFVCILPENIRSRFAQHADYSVEENVALAYGGFLDVLLRAGRDAIAIELKIDHRENPFQYANYRQALEKLGLRPFMIGVVRRDRASRGRELLNFAAVSALADHRLTWAALVDGLGDALNGEPTLARLRSEIRSIDPTLLEPEARRPATRPTRRIDQVDIDPVELGAFFADLISALPSGLSGYPDQAGNSPPLFRFGKPAWSERFGDGYPERMFLMVDVPRGSKRLAESYLHFGISLWDKAKSDSPRVPNLEMVRAIAGSLHRSGFHFQRNTPGKYPPMSWAPPFATDRVGFFYANAFDEAHFKLTKTDATRLGWDASIQRLATRSAELINIFENA